VLINNESKAVNYITANLSNEEYHSMAGISSSHFKLMERSPLHYWQAYVNPEREKREPTAAMLIGTAWHTAVFEPEHFKRDFVEVPEGIDRRTKEGKAFFAEIEASGKTPFKPDEFQQVVRMANLASSHPVMSMLLSHEQCIIENSIFIVDEETSLTLKIRPDLAIMPCDQFPHGLILDGKTTQDASPAEFGRSYWNLSYHYQAAFYCDVWQRFWKTQQRPPFLYFCQEKDAPHATAMYSAPAKMIDFGHKRYREQLIKIVECHRAQEWQSYSKEITNLTLPVWAEKEIDG
jgi:exodeoxyribonuclease VIII